MNNIKNEITVKMVVKSIPAAVHQTPMTTSNEILCHRAREEVTGQAFSRRRAVVHVIGHELQQNSVKRA